MVWPIAMTLAYLGVVGASIRVELHLPAPCRPTSDSRCTCKYQAILEELLSFEAVAHTKQVIAMNFGILEQDSNSPVNGCRIEECPENITCHHSCHSGRAATSTVGYRLYDVRASPYDQRKNSDTVKTLCIEVNSSVGLVFDKYPGSLVTTTDGRVTLAYIASGYPGPEAYALVCDGVVRQQNEQGLFHLDGLPNGQQHCHAEAINRLSRARSNMTLISITKPPALSNGDATAEPSPDASSQRPFLPPPPPPSVLLPVGKDQEMPMIVGSVIGVGLTISIAIVIRMLLLRSRRNREKTPPNVINIINDNSHHTTFIHNGDKVESYGPGSVIKCHRSDATESPLLHSNSTGSEQSCHIWTEIGTDAGSYGPAGTIAYSLADHTGYPARDS